MNNIHSEVQLLEKFSEALNNLCIKESLASTWHVCPIQNKYVFDLA